MGKTIKNCFDSKLTFEKLLEAHKRARKGKGYKKDVIKFEMDLETNIISIYKELKNNTYKVSKYYEFTIYEPKERIIKALPYKDRVIQQWYIEEFIKPFIIKRFINDTYACINGRGIHTAVVKAQKYLRKTKKCYILKCDIKKYFYNIDKDILFNIMKKYISDKKLLNLTKIFIYDEEKLGIPIGNYTSQYFANIYLNELDHYVKETLRIKYYLRYMDDFIIFCKDKMEAKEILNKIRIYLKDNLKLELNKKTNYYPSYKGINFCGYITYRRYRKLRKRNVKKLLKKIKKWNINYHNNELDYNKFKASYKSFIAYLGYSNYNLNRYNNKIEFEVDLFN